MKVWHDRIRDRHIVSIQAARQGPPPPGQSQRAKRELYAGTKSLSECFRAGRLELLERLKRLEQAPLVERLEPLEQASFWRAHACNEKNHYLMLSNHEARLPCFQVRAHYNRPMATIAEIEKLALDCLKTKGPVLAAHLLGSLPPVLHDEDEGIAEALRRDAELEANPSAGLSLEQLDQQIERRRT